MSKATAAFEALKASAEPFVMATDVAPVLGVDAQSLRLQMKEDATALGFKVTKVGGRTLIPRLAFLRYVEGA